MMRGKLISNEKVMVFLSLIKYLEKISEFEVKIQILTSKEWIST